MNEAWAMISETVAYVIHEISLLPWWGQALAYGFIGLQVYGLFAYGIGDMDCETTICKR